MIASSTGIASWRPVGSSIVSNVLPSWERWTSRIVRWLLTSKEIVFIPAFSSNLYVYFGYRYQV